MPRSRRPRDCPIHDDPASFPSEYVECQIQCRDAVPVHPGDIRCPVGCSVPAIVEGEDQVPRLDEPQDRVDLGAHDFPRSRGRRESSPSVGRGGEGSSREAGRRPSKEKKTSSSEPSPRSGGAASSRAGWKNMGAHPPRARESSRAAAKAGARACKRRSRSVRSMPIDYLMARVWNPLRFRAPRESTLVPGAAGGLKYLDAHRPAQVSRPSFTSSGRWRTSTSSSR